MKRIVLVLLVSTILFSSCTDNKKQVVDNYLYYGNNYDTENLSNILDENFSFTFLAKSRDKAEFLNSQKNDTIFRYQNEISDYKIVNDSIIETVETSGNIYQNHTNLIPKYKIKKTYVIIDNKVYKIYSDTLSGYSEITSILNYIARDFQSWILENNIDIENNYSKEFFSSLVDRFYASYPLQEIVENKLYLIDEFIEFVKNYEFNVEADKMTYEDLFNKVAGLEGTVKWSSFVPDKYSSNPNIRAVDIFIDRNNEESEYRTLKLQYVVNPKNKIADLKYGEINGKPVSILDLSMTIELILGLGSYI